MLMVVYIEQNHQSQFYPFNGSLKRAKVIASPLPPVIVFSRVMFDQLILRMAVEFIMPDILRLVSNSWREILRNVARFLKNHISK